MSEHSILPCSQELLDEIRIESFNSGSGICIFNKVRKPAMSSRTPAIVFDQPHLVSNIESHLTYAYGIHPVAKIFWDAIRERAGEAMSTGQPSWYHEIKDDTAACNFDQLDEAIWCARRLVDYDNDDRYDDWDICIFLGGPFSPEDEYLHNGDFRCAVNRRVIKHIE